MHWTIENVATVRDIFKQADTVGWAMVRVRTKFGAVTFDAVRRAFHRHGLGSPKLYLRNVTVADVTASKVTGAVCDVKFAKAGKFTCASVANDKFDVTAEYSDGTKLAWRGVDVVVNSTKKDPGKPTSRIVVVSDLHAPYHDKAAWACLLEVIRKTKPGTVVIIGDFADMYAISSHPKSLDRKRDFANELAGVNEVLDELRDAAGDDCRIVWTEGNHEDRITRYLQSSAPELGGIKELRAEGLFKCKERNIEYIPYRRAIKIGNCSFTHDVGRCGVNAARQSLMDYGGNLVFGHSHRGAVVYQGESKGSSHFAMNVGWLGDVNEIDYIHQCRARRDWQTGFGIVDQDETGYSWASFIPVIDGRCVVDGKLISGARLAA